MFDLPPDFVEIYATVRLFSPSDVNRTTDCTTRKKVLYWQRFDGEIGSVGVARPDRVIGSRLGSVISGSPIRECVSEIIYCLRRRYLDDDRVILKHLYSRWRVNLCSTVNFHFTTE